MVTNSGYSIGAVRNPGKNPRYNFPKKYDFSSKLSGDKNLTFVDHMIVFIQYIEINHKQCGRHLV